MQGIQYGVSQKGVLLTVLFYIDYESIVPPFGQGLAVHFHHRLACFQIESLIVICLARL
ncbi:hypothetical protein BMETH_2439_0 [methanotrophic bacterial endosymbiont of Bathymodiolus sp.]|nr:hypothetical protein BMETH_2439_0 [methanotrophic bacterial endosymbiont of Bathymodiolus sp.]